MTGAEMRARRLSLGLSMHQLSLAAGTSEYSVHAAETGRHRINPAVMARILAALENPDLIPEAKHVRADVPEDTQGKKLRRYVLRSGTAYTFTKMTTSGLNTKMLVFLRDTRDCGAGVHHVFRHGTGYIETFTDAACMDWTIKEARNEVH